MAAHKGNEYWQSRKKHGKPKNIETPEELWGYFCDYASRIDDNPHSLLETKRGSGSTQQGAFDKEEEKEERRDFPYTWEGFEDYLFEKSIISDLGDYRSNKEGRYQDFAAIIKKIGNCIYNNKFSGAAIGIFNANIIARDLGLVDKTEQENKGSLTIKHRTIETTPQDEESDEIG